MLKKVGLNDLCWCGFFSNSSGMFCIGNVSPKKKKLVDVAKECIELELAQIKSWDFRK
jgi:methionyl aminopeptidase